MNAKKLEWVKPSSNVYFQNVNGLHTELLALTTCIYDAILLYETNLTPQLQDSFNYTEPFSSHKSSGDGVLIAVKNNI